MERFKAGMGHMDCRGKETTGGVLSSQNFLLGIENRASIPPLNRVVSAASEEAVLCCARRGRNLRRLQKVSGSARRASRRLVGTARGAAARFEIRAGIRHSIWPARSDKQK